MSEELQYIKGIGPRRAAVLGKAGINTAEELIGFFPRRYLDRTTVRKLDELRVDEEITVLGKIEAAGIRPLRRRIFYIVISDGKGLLEAVWFNNADHFSKIFSVGEWVSLSGKVTFYRGYQMTHPDFDKFGDGDIDSMMNVGKIIPLYPSGEALKRAGLHSYTFHRIFEYLFEQKTPAMPETLPAALRAKRGFPAAADAYQHMHLPPDRESLDAAISRFKYEEFFFLQVMLGLQNYHFQQEEAGIAFNKPSTHLEKLYKKLPFAMTEAQKRVVKEIRGDMRQPHPMNRLLQGDVGAGKTLVALMAMLIAVDNGYQAALMAPTEILAEQHFINIEKQLSGYGIPVHLLTGSTSKADREVIQSEIARDEAMIVIGTHALIQEGVDFSRLGLVVIDEQHRFGVMQRATLSKKGIMADVLVMTATPIPRTLALTVYGSLDVSILDEMPANRKPIQTLWRFDNKAADIYRYIRERIAGGDQAYIVFPLVEESEKIDLKAATESYDKFSKSVFKDIPMALLHGRMKSNEKEQVMREFSAGKVKILVSTTVIEVGVDVPNATIMLIEHAERFGLAQLHQLRGRVGRGDKKSACILKTPYNIGDVAQKRMKLMTETTDGFKIAEEDLRLRGWGDFFGTRQSGMPEFKLANPIADQDVLQQARGDAFELVQSDPHLRKPENNSMIQILKAKFSDRLDLIKIG
jgi:ATP-dependent DNA helicase RecG